MAGAITGLLESSYAASGVVTAMRFVKVSAETTVVRCGVSGEEALGVAHDDISAGEATAGKLTAVQELGIAWVEAGAAVTLGDNIMTDNVGRAVTATTGLVILGKCRKAAANAGELCLVDLAGTGHTVV